MTAEHGCNQVETITRVIVTQEVLTKAVDEQRELMKAQTMATGRLADVLDRLVDVGRMEGGIQESRANERELFTRVRELEMAPAKESLSVKQGATIALISSVIAGIATYIFK